MMLGKREPKRTAEERCIDPKYSGVQVSIKKWTDEWWDDLNSKNDNHNTIIWYPCCNTFCSRYFEFHEEHCQVGSMTWKRFLKQSKIDSKEKFGIGMVNYLLRQDQDGQTCYKPGYNQRHIKEVELLDEIQMARDELKDKSNAIKTLQEELRTTKTELTALQKESAEKDAVIAWLKEEMKKANVNQDLLEKKHQALTEIAMKCKGCKKKIVNEEGQENIPKIEKKNNK